MWIKSNLKGGRVDMKKSKSNKNKIYINKKNIKFIKKKEFEKIKPNIVTILLFSIKVQSSKVFGASDPTLVTKINSAFKKILTYLQKIATPIAGVSIATGVLMRKLSFGDEEKLVKGKKIIINAIIGYAIIISIDLIIKFVDFLF